MGHHVGILGWEFINGASAFGLLYLSNSIDGVINSILTVSGVSRVFVYGAEDLDAVNVFSENSAHCSWTRWNCYHYFLLLVRIFPSVFGNAVSSPLAQVQQLELDSSGVLVRWYSDGFNFATFISYILDLEYIVMSAVTGHGTFYCISNLPKKLWFSLVHDVDTQFVALSPGVAFHSPSVNLLWWFYASSKYWESTCQENIWFARQVDPEICGIFLLLLHWRMSKRAFVLDQKS